MIIQRIACQVCTAMQAHHAEDEIFSSTHKDTIVADSVTWTCAVLPMEKYVAYLNHKHERSGRKPVASPVTSVKLNPAIDLAACEDLCKLDTFPDNNASAQALKNRSMRSEDRDANGEAANGGAAGKLLVLQGIL